MSEIIRIFVVLNIKKVKNMAKIETTLAEQEVSELKKDGLNFEYDFVTNDIINYDNIIIDEKFDMKEIISNEKYGKKIIFSLNRGEVPIVDFLKKSSVKNYNRVQEQTIGSIYWNVPMGKMIRIKCYEK